MMLTVAVMCMLVTSASSGFMTPQQQLTQCYIAVRELTWLDTEWVLAYRLTAGTKTSAYDHFVDNTRNDDRPLALAFRPLACLDPSDLSLDCRRHYHSALLNNWPSEFIDQVRLSLVTGEEEVAYILFNGTGSTQTSWFSKDRILNSSWTDLETEQQNYFSIEGHHKSKPAHHTHSRRFYVFRNYDGCPRDNGWLSIQDQQTEVCAWGNLNSTHPFPAILYSKRPTYVNFNTADVGLADFLTVAVKFIHE